MMTVIEMARKTKLDIYSLTWPHDKFIERLEAFAELVRADSSNATLDEIALFIENYVEGYDRDYRELGLELADEIRSRKT